MYKWQNVRIKILVLKFNTVILFGLNRLKGKNKVTSLSISIHTAFMYIWEDALYIKILQQEELFMSQSTCRKESIFKNTSTSVAPSPTDRSL